MSFKIAIDAGHGFNTPGKRTPNGVREWTLNHAVAIFLENELNNYDVEIIRTDDRTGVIDVDLNERVNRANNFGAEAFVSIHHNAYNGKWGNHTGVEVYHANPNMKDHELAKVVAPKLAEKTGLKNRGVKFAQFVVLSVKATAILCEGGFMDSNIDNPMITSEKGQKAYAQAVCEGLVQFFGLKKKSSADVKASICPTCGQSVNNRYIVQSGDTLWSIANRFQTSVDSLKKLNNLKSDLIKPGQILILK